MNEQEKSVKRIQELDAFRLVAIVMIACSHLFFLDRSEKIGIVYRWFSNPTLGTDYFFVLSGFGLRMSWEKIETKSSCKMNGLRFAFNKVKKMYPMYILTCLTMIPYSVICDIQDSTLKISVVKTLLKLLGCASLFQSGFGSSYTSHALNAPCWFLSTLFICYIFVYYAMPELDKASRNSKPRLMVIIILNGLLIIILSSFFVMIEQAFCANGIPYINDLFYGSPYIRFLYVTLGVFVAEEYIYDNVVISGNKDRNKWRVYEIPLETLVLVWFFIRNIVGTSSGILRLFDIIAVLITMKELLYGTHLRRILNWKIAKIGKVSWIIFLVHYPIIVNVDLIIMKFTRAQSDAILLLEFTLDILLTILVLKFVNKQIIRKKVN